MCPQIRETILAELHKASSALHYNNSVPKDAFLCLEHSTDTATPHASVVASIRTVMTCTLNPDEVFNNLTEEHLVWFSSSDTPGEQLTTRVLFSQDVTLWMIVCTICMCVHLVTVFVASIDTCSSGVAREPPPSVAMHHPGGVLTTGE